MDLRWLILLSVISIVQANEAEILNRKNEDWRKHKENFKK